MKGYNGKILLADLGEKASRVLNFDEGFARKWIGGSGMGVHFLLRYCTPRTEALSPSNPLILFTGPFQGTGVPTSGRHQVTTKSPLTGVICESDAGGTFGFHLKRSGFDGLILLGKSAEPIYLHLENGEAFFRSAQDMWGLDTMETDAELARRHKGPHGAVCIGPAGEKMVPLAGIFSDGPDARAAGRGGAGAVMGSKNLKAIVASGNTATDCFDRKGLTESVSRKNKVLRDKGAKLTMYGTAGGMALAEEMGDLPIRNWSLGSWTEEVKPVTGQKMAETILSGNYGCMACPIRCGRVVSLNGTSVAGPEYETMAMLGSNCLVGDLDAIARANDMCNRLGLDTISTGSAIGFAMELFERGIVTQGDTGMPIRWGDGEAVVELARQIGMKESFGRTLGLGTRAAARRIGGGAEAFAVHVNGLELPAHDPRCFKSLAVAYATSSRGTCHLNGYTYPWERSASFPELGYPEKLDRTIDEGKGVMAARFQNLMSVIDSLKICKFAVTVDVNIADMLEWIKLVTGWKMTMDELMETGERIFTARRLFNAGTGLDRSADVLPRRIEHETRGSGGSAETLPDLPLQLEEYYRTRGWDKRGFPTQGDLNRLDIQEFAHWLPRK